MLESNFFHGNSRDITRIETIAYDQIVKKIILGVRHTLYYIVYLYEYISICFT